MCRIIATLSETHRPQVDVFFLRLPSEATYLTANEMVENVFIIVIFKNDKESSGKMIGFYRMKIKYTLI